MELWLQKGRDMDCTGKNPMRGTGIGHLQEPFALCLIELAPQVHVELDTRGLAASLRGWMKG